MNPSPSSRRSSRHRLTYRWTIEYEPSNPCSATSRSYTRRAVCRCLRGIRKSAPSHASTVCAYASIPDARAGREAGFGEQSSICAYFLTVSRDTPRRRAISRHGTPFASRSLISCRTGTGFVIPFLPESHWNLQFGKIPRFARNRCPHPTEVTKRTKTNRSHGLIPDAQPAHFLLNNHSVRPGLAGNPHPTLPGARATQHVCRLDITAPAASREGTQAALRHTDEGAGRRPGGGVGRRIERLAPQVEGIPGGTHPRAGTTCPTRRRPGRNGGGPTAMSAAAIGGWNDCSARGGYSHSATRRFLGKGHGAQHQQARGRRQLADQTHACTPSRPDRGTHEKGRRMCLLHEKRIPRPARAHTGHRRGNTERMRRPCRTNPKPGMTTTTASSNTTGTTPPSRQDSTSAKDTSDSQKRSLKHHVFPIRPNEHKHR